MPKKKRNRHTAAQLPATTPMRTPRNPYANHPLMAKGGVHQKSKSATRAAVRRETRKLARDWPSYILISLKTFNLA